MTKIPYPYLPEGHTFGYVPSDDPFMLAAKEAQEGLSTDRQHGTGAVIVQNGQIVGRGGNKTFYRRSFWVNLHATGWICPRKWLKTPSGQKYYLCPGCSSSKDHAEPRAIADAQRNGHETKGVALYLYGHWWCCHGCWDAILEAGISKVYLLEGSEILFNRDHPDNIL